MAMMRTRYRSVKAPEGQLHIDLGALAQRVTGMEASFSGFADSISTQIRDLGRKFDQQQESFNAAKRTDWSSIWQASAVVIALVGAILWPQITGLNKLTDLVEKMQNTYVRVSDLQASSEILRGRIAQQDSLLAILDASKIGVREHEEFKARMDRELAGEISARKDAYSHIDQSLRDLDGQLVKRPEISAANKVLGERLDSLSAHYDSLQKQMADAEAIVLAGGRGVKP